MPSINIPSLALPDFSDLASGRDAFQSLRDAENSLRVAMAAVRDESVDTSGWLRGPTPMERLWAGKPERSAGVSREMFNAVHDGDFEAVQSMANSGFDPLALDEQGRTALMVALACPSNDSRIVKALAACGGVDSRGPGGSTALMAAAKHDRDVGIELIGLSDVDVQDDHGRTALMFSLGRHSGPTMLMAALALASNPNLPDGDGISAAFMILRMIDPNQAMGVFSLVQDRVDPCQADPMGLHLDQLASSRGFSGIAAAMLARREDAELRAETPRAVGRSAPLHL